MCGIAGFIGEGDKKNLLTMIDSIRYRGPDDMGHFLKNEVGFAHARLSILDLSADGHQPIIHMQCGHHVVEKRYTFGFPSGVLQISPEVVEKVVIPAAVSLLII